MSRFIFSKATLFLIATGVVAVTYQNCGNAEFLISESKAGAFSITDSDGDGLGDNTELGLGTNPQLADTDGDGLTDSAEINTYNTDPNKFDTDGGGKNDGTDGQRSDMNFKVE